MTKIRNWNTSVPSKGEVNTKPSLTVPDMTPPLDVMIRKYVSGQKIDVFQGVYDEDSDIPVDIERMTPQERLDYARALRGYINDQRTILSSVDKREAPPVEVTPVKDPVEPTKGADGVE